MESMIVNVKLYCPKHPEGQVFTTQSDVEIALVQGWHYKEEVIAKPVPMTKEDWRVCACGCGVEIKKGKYYSQDCYHRHQRGEKKWRFRGPSKT